MSDEEVADEVPEAELTEAEPGGTKRGLSAGKIAAIAVAVVLAAGFVVGLVASKHQKDDEQAATASSVANVNGVEISRASLDDEVNHWIANKDYVKAAAAQQQQMVQPNGRPTADFERDILTQQIENVVFQREFDRRKLKVTEADRAQLRQQIAGNAALQKYPKAFLDSILERAARVSVLQRALATKPTEAEIQQAYDEQYACPTGKDVAHILVKTRAEADAIEAQLAGGANFAEIAKEKSTDTGSGPGGGALGCLKTGTFVAPFEQGALAAEVGKPTAPVQTEFGYHVILVTPHSNATDPPLASVRDQIVQALSQSTTQFNTFADNAFAKAKVTVDPTLGSWAKSGQTFQVVPRTGSTTPSSGSTPSSAAGSLVPPPVISERP